MIRHFPRPTLAQAYLAQLLEGEEPLALFSPRRTGKTEFLRKDLTPAADAAGMLVVYVDLWQDKTSAAVALTYALSSAVDDLLVPSSKVGRGLAAPVRGVSILGSGVTFGEDAKRAEPESQFVEIDQLLRRLTLESGKKVLLLLDEVQQLALDQDGEAIVAALRASLTKLQGRVYAVLTGSSRDLLNDLFFRAKAPMYEFASVIRFPLLGKEFIEYALERFRRLTDRTLDVQEMLPAFERLDHRPKLLARLLEQLESHPQLSIADALRALQVERDREHDYAGAWRSLSALQQALLVRVAAGAELYSAKALEDYGVRLGTSVNPGSVKRAVDQLRKKGMLTKLSEGLIFESNTFLEFVQKADPEKGS